MERLPFLKIFDDEKLQKIEEMAAHILEDIGLEFRDDPISLEVLQGVGAKVDGSRLRVSFDILKNLIAKAPSSFKWRGIEEEKTVILGEEADPVFAPMFGAPNVRRWEGTTQLGTYDDYVDLVKLCEEFPSIGTSGYLLCIIHDRTEKTKHLDMAQVHLKHSTKPMMGCIMSETALKEVATEVGATDFIEGECKLLHMINTTPPLVVQENPLKCLRAASELGQGSVISSYMMMGCTSMVTIPETLAQGLAEVMVAAALTQIYQPGVPVVGGIFGTPFSMRSMLPNYGGAESAQVQMAGAQLLRRLGLPTRGDGFLTSSKIMDQQAYYEGIDTMQASLHSGANLILHSSGWLEKGRCLDLNKFVFDAEHIEELDKVYY